MSLDLENDRKPRIDKITIECFRKGKCAVCTGSVERIRSFTGKTLEECDEQRKAWEKTELRHKRCE